MIRLTGLEISKNYVVIGQHKLVAYTSMGVKDLHCILTKDEDFRDIKRRIEEFLRYAKKRPTSKFWITSTVGNNIDIAPMFAHAPSNVVFPRKWVDILGLEEGRQYWYG
jgi:hypothetical protein